VHASNAITPSAVPLDASGKASERLFAIGPMCRGTLPEIMFVRDIRTQCATLATQILSDERAGIAVA
jgi:uncharacterized NAD(P)/FAD-binding protein YdhS